MITRRPGDAGEPPAGPGHPAQGAAGVPAQRLHHLDDGDLPADLPHPTPGRRLRPARVGIDRSQPRASAAVHARDPGDRTGGGRRLFGGRRAPAGHARAGADHAGSPRGIPARQGAGGARPSVTVAYAVYAVFLACVGLFARPAVASSLLRAPDLLAQLLFTPLLAGWSIWVGIAISARARDFRVAQQLGILASLPTAVVAALVAFDVLHPTLGLALGFAAALLVGNGLGWRITAAAFDRERLVART